MTKNETIAEKIVDEIIHDMCGRSGGDHWFEGCDKEIQDEIREEWEEIVKIHLAGEDKP